MAYAFENMKAWQEARKLVGETYRLLNDFPKFENYALCDQIRRAVVSVSSNLAEGSGRISVKEHLRFYEIAYGSLMETYNQLIIATDLKYLDENRVTLEYDLPLNEIIYDFFDTIKSKTKGYASVDYEFKEYRRSDLVKLDLHINNQPVDALSFIVHKDSAYSRGRKMAEKLKKEIPRQLFEIPVQAVVGGKIIARETISAMRKDVLAKCYGGDITRKKKLLEKQKKGKKKMRQIGNVEVPQEAFLAVLKLDDGD